MKKLFWILLAAAQSMAWAQIPQPSLDDLQRAIANNDAARVAYLFREHRFDPNFYLPNGDTPLVYAIRMKSLYTVNAVLLKHHQLNVKIPTLRGETPLMLAAYAGDMELARKLLARGADVNVNFGWTALHYAAARGHTEMIELLLKQGADVNALTERQVTPLYMAARTVAISSVEALLKAGADKTICNDQGISPAMIAKKFGNSALAERLAIDACKVTDPAPMTAPSPDNTTSPTESSHVQSATP